MAEFVGIRAQLYKEALAEFPEARKGDIELMKKYFAPKEGEVVLEVGAGSGLFSGTLAEIVGVKGKVFVLDPSLEQLAGVEDLGKPNIEIVNKGIADFKLAENSIDGVWSFGAFHHVFAKTTAFKNINLMLKKCGRLVIGDVFSDSALARHFDERVARYSVTGHEVAFWSREYAESLCDLTGFEKPTFQDFNANWKFNKKEDIGVFLHKLHALTKTTPEEILRGAEEILGIEEHDGFYYLNWPMIMIITSKK